MKSQALGIIHKLLRLDYVKEIKIEKLGDKIEIWDGSRYMGRFQLFDKDEKPIGYFDMDGVTCNYRKRVDELIAAGSAKDNDAARRQKGFFESLEPMQGALLAYHTLSQYFDIYFLSQPSWSNPDSFSEKRIWLEKHLGEAAKKKLILTHRKDLNNGLFLIDDHIEGNNGRFPGHIIHFGSETFPDWSTTIKHIKDTFVNE